MAESSGGGFSWDKAGMILQGGAQLSGAVSEYYAMQAQSAYQRQIAEIDQKLSAFQAESVIKQGKQAAKEHKQETSALIGSQRAALAAQGLDPNAGTALEIQVQTAERGARDAVTIRNNAWLTAWGIKVEATNRKYASAFQQMGSRNAAQSTIVTGGMNATGSFARAYKTK